MSHATFQLVDIISTAVNLSGNLPRPLVAQWAVGKIEEWAESGIVEQVEPQIYDAVVYKVNTVVAARKSKFKPIPENSPEAQSRLIEFYNTAVV